MPIGLTGGARPAARPSGAPERRAGKGLALLGALWVPDGGLMWDALVALLALAGVLALAYFTSKALSARMQGLTRTPHMRVLDRLVLGRDKTVLILKIGDRILCVGVTQSNMSLLTEMEPQELNAAERQQADGQTDTNGADGRSAAGRPSAFSGFMARFWAYFVSYLTGKPPKLPSRESAVAYHEDCERAGAAPVHIEPMETVSSPAAKAEEDLFEAAGEAERFSAEEEPALELRERDEEPAAESKVELESEAGSEPGKEVLLGESEEELSEAGDEPDSETEPEAGPGAEPEPEPESEPELPLSAMRVSMPELPDTAGAQALLSRYQKAPPPPASPEPKPLEKKMPEVKAPSIPAVSPPVAERPASPVIGRPDGKDFGELLRRELDREDAPRSPSGEARPENPSGKGDAVDVLFSRIHDLQKRYEKKLESER